MVENGQEMTIKLLELTNRTGYPIVQHNGQRRFGPPPEWIGPPPVKGCEVFVGKLPREMFEDEIVPVFTKVGKIYEMRLMMDFSGSNRGYAFVTYSTRSEALRAVKELNGFEIRPGKFIGVVKSVDNCRLFIGGLPKTKTKEEIMAELSKHVGGLVGVILYKNCYDKRLTRGFAFVEFTSHRAAAMARRALVPGCVRLWDQEVMVDWAEPEPEIDDEQMKKVKVLYIRNLLIKTTPQAIKAVVESMINNNIEKVKKIFDYAFIHFHEREHAELALVKLQNAVIDGSTLEVNWAKPVDRELYRIQKMMKGNAKFNSSLNLSQTLALYKQQLDRREFTKSPRDECMHACSTSNGDSSYGSTTDARFWNFQSLAPKSDYALAPAKLDSLCRRNGWLPPKFEYQRFVDPAGAILWICSVHLPHVGLPLLYIPRQIGPFMTRATCSMKQAQIEAAEIVLHHLKMLRPEGVHRTAPVPAQMQPMYSPSLFQPVVNYNSYEYVYQNPVYQSPQSVLPIKFDNMQLF